MHSYLPLSIENMNQPITTIEGMMESPIPKILKTNGPYNVAIVPQDLF